MQSPFASYRGGFQVLPQGWMESATAPGRNYAQGAQALGSSMVKAAGVVRENMGEQASNAAAAPTLMSQYEQMSQATGQEMDPTIIDRFSKLGDMSGSQLAQFNKDVSGAMGFQKDLYALGRQQQAYDLQMEAQRRAMAAMEQQKNAQNVGNMLTSRNTPPVQNYVSQSAQVTTPAARPDSGSFYFQGKQVTPTMLGAQATPQTIQGINMGLY